MRITLLHPPRTGGAGTNLVPPIGLLYLGAVLEKAGHIVSLVDAALTGHTDKILQDDIIETAPDLLMISAFTSDVFLLRPQITSLRRMLPEIPFWLGGPHASCAGLQVLIDFPEIDAFFMGESEESVLELISSDSSEKAPDGVVLRTAPSATHPRHIHDLSVLPVPAWHLAPPEKYRGLPNGVILKRLPYAPILATRGCPYKCTFCAGFRTTGREIRKRPLPQVWKEIEILIQDYGVKEIHIEDDNFSLDYDYVSEFCREAIRRNLPVLFSTPNGIRLDTLDDELLELMKKAGWYIIHCGIESGSDRILKKIKKATTTKILQEKIDLIHKHGLPVVGYFILGIPDETEEDIMETIRFSLSSGIEWAQFASFLPIPGSEDGDKFLRNHDLASEGWKKFHNTTCVAPPDTISRKRMKHLQRKAFLSFYLRPRPFLRVIGLFYHTGSSGRLLRRILAYLMTGKEY